MKTILTLTFVAVAMYIGWLLYLVINELFRSK